MKPRGPTDYPAAPRVTRFVLAVLRVPRAEREFIKGDLDEGFAAEAAAHGALRARLWYWRQLASMVRVPWRRTAGAPREASRRRPGVGFVADLRYAVRSLRRAPLFSLLVLCTLAIGVGATTAVFSIVHPIVLAEPPYRDADRLAMIWQRGLQGEKDRVGYLTADDLRRESRVFESVAVIGSWTPTLRADDAAQRMAAAVVSWNYFGLLGVRPALGRDFVPEDDTPQTRRVVLLSHALWVANYGGDTAVVGSRTTINGLEYTVAGVMPEGFRDLLSPQAQLWSPLGYTRDRGSACRTCQHLRAIGRLRPGVSPDDAARETNAFFATMRARHPDDYATDASFVIALRDELASGVRTPLFGLFGAVALLMLLACTNVANLFLGRTGERQTELAIRLALGAERGRLVRLVSLEAGVLAVAGGALGLAVAWMGTRVLVEVMPVPVELATRVRMSGAVVALAAGVTALAALIGAALPALLALGESALADIRVGSRAVIGRARHRLRHAVVVLEVALAVLLLAGAGLQVRSLREALAVDLGFEPRGVLTMEFTLSGPRYRETRDAHVFYRQVLDGARGVPGVEGAAVVSQIPLGGNFDGYGVHRVDAPSVNPSEDPGAQGFAVSVDYLDVMGIPVLRGRGFTSADRDGGDFVVLVNRAAVDNIYAGADPIGRQIRIAGNAGPPRTIVGVVENVRHLSLEGEPESQVYLPFDQHPWTVDFSLVARTGGDPVAIANPLRRVALGVDPGVAISAVRPMDDVISAVAAPRRLAMSLVGGFAAIAIVLALGGLYGVMTASVSERVREIGLRSALGATPGRLVGQVILRGLALTAIGTAIGVGAFLAARTVLARFVFGVSASDPMTLAGVAGLLGVVAILACALPAARAARIEPLVALRE